eukprot:TRINITY_DN13103_c0_g1_i2.p1 TRINITY_DN13103_c0_g1~~TRINITY_DN13103_c0_g1_i2.p1  ORF type:complete len:263 (+),score=46.53 TRINITY_DN13103_c0_g1_i2:61-789(+)
MGVLINLPSGTTGIPGRGGNNGVSGPLVISGVLTPTNNSGVFEKLSGPLPQPDVGPTEVDKVKFPGIKFVGVLDGHRDTVLCIRVSGEFGVVVSGSSDKTCIVWDLNRVSYIRSLSPHNGPVLALDIHRYTAEIASVDSTGNDSGTLHLWTLNGEKVSSKRCRPQPTSVSFSHIKPGLGRNIILTGHTNGEIKLWCASTLNHLQSINVHPLSPVTVITVSEDNQAIASGDAAGNCFKHTPRR